MPLVAWTALAYAAGLGLAFALEPGSAGPLAAAGLSVLAVVPLVSAWRLEPLPPKLVRVVALCVVATAGLLAGIATNGDDTRCGESLQARAEFDVRLDGDAAPGGVAHGTVIRSSCAARVTMLVAAGEARAGDDVRVTGAAQFDARGLFVRAARLGQPTRSPSFASARAGVGRRVDALFRDDAPMVRALVLGDMSAIPADQRDRFARAGLVHMLSVSGLHVAIIALALELLAGALRLPPNPARLASLALVAAYVAAIGAPPPAVRAAVMLGIMALTRVLQRPTSPWAVVALGGVAPLADARVVTDLGWQLSVAGTVALVAGGALAARVIPDLWGGPRRSIARGALVSVVATAVTAPLVAWTFGRVALLGPVTNLLADPVMGLLQPVLFLALAIPIRAVAAVLADAAHALLWLFDAIAARAAAIPGAAPAVMPSVASAILAGIVALCVVVACCSRRSSRALVVGSACLVAMVTLPLLRLPGGQTELHLIDVGQGDAIAVRTRAGRWIVVDAGRSWAGGDAGRRTVVPYIAHRGGDVALFVLSHPHADHVGGAASLFTALHPARFLDPGYPGSTPPYLAALASARAERIPWQRVHPGDSLAVDEVMLTALAPDSAWSAGLTDVNLASTVLRVRVGAVRMLLTGDAEQPEEDWMLSRDPAALAADVLKVGHHGSSTSTSAPFLAAVHPRLALVSVGAHNTYGHPDASVMSALHAAGAQVLRTDRAGTVVVRTDGRRIEVEGRGSRWVLPDRPPSP